MWKELAQKNYNLIEIIIELNNKKNLIFCPFFSIFQHLFIEKIKYLTRPPLNTSRNFLHAPLFNCQQKILFQDEEFEEMLRSSRRIEFLYSHLFDEAVVNLDLSTAFEQLLRAARRVETEPLWVPASWVQWAPSANHPASKGFCLFIYLFFGRQKLAWDVTIRDAGQSVNVLN